MHDCIQKYFLKYIHLIWVYLNRVKDIYIDLNRKWCQIRHCRMHKIYVFALLQCMCPHVYACMFVCMCGCVCMYVNTTAFSMSFTLLFHPIFNPFNFTSSFTTFVMFILFLILIMSCGLIYNPEEISTKLFLFLKNLNNE